MRKTPISFFNKKILIEEEGFFEKVKFFSKTFDKYVRKIKFLFGKEGEKMVDIKGAKAVGGELAGGASTRRAKLGIVVHGTGRCRSEIVISGVGKLRAFGSSFKLEIVGLGEGDREYLLHESTIRLPKVPGPSDSMAINFPALPQTPCRDVNAVSRPLFGVRIELARVSGNGKFMLTKELSSRYLRNIVGRSLDYHFF